MSEVTHTFQTDIGTLSVTLTKEGDFTLRLTEERPNSEPDSFSVIIDDDLAYAVAHAIFSLRTERALRGARRPHSEAAARATDSSP